LSQSYKICPICKSHAHPNAVICSTCGATLSDVRPVGKSVPKDDSKPLYDHRYGEADLLESQTSRRSDVLFVGVMLTVAMIVCIAAVLFIGPRLFKNLVPASAVRGAASVTPVPTRGVSVPGATSAPAISNTPRPTLQFATVTPAPPTPTVTPTQGPCTRKVQAGDDLVSLAFSCGHRHLDVIDTIVEMNNLDAADSIQVGQEIIIPWPTATIDPNTIPTQPPDGDAQVDEVADANVTLAPADRALRNSMALATETLQPGITYHRVVAGESVASIAYQYNANIEVLSQLNPEMSFSQCDFSAPSGGPSCIAPVFAGQLVRVPAPTPTPTLSPTPSGSETATPTATATYNAPSLIEPGNRSLFTRDQLVTLRWVASGTLGADQAYQVRVEDTTIGAVYVANTQALFLIIPEGWQGRDGRRHDYTWKVSVIYKDRPDQPSYTTDTRLFSWEALQ
jgi:LysM repeat protein